ncbi:hypothetical protein [Virgisporangium aliadipatigenens]|uniref:hypothetical protein n=1 Tax=Virgisporangium aliadipatigenens TaxID=741659 RepID=UPI001940DF40|nr:hypothetical protein [Virgisporangium aliadipatigenens]
MSDLHTGAYPSTSTTDGQASKTRNVVQHGTEAAGQAAGEVKETAAQQARRVAAETGTQARSVASDVRDRLGEQARTQNDRLVSGIRQTADHLDEMRGDRTDTPAATMVSRVADSGRQFADYLDRNGLEGVLAEVQDFARRRPGAFVAAALATGFIVGRLGKSVAKADPTAGQPAHDTVRPAAAPPATVAPRTPPVPAAPPAPATPPSTVTTGEYTTTQYAATGTGAPVVVEEEYPAAPDREARR